LSLTFSPFSSSTISVLVIVAINFYLKWNTLAQDAYSQNFTIKGRDFLGWGIHHDEKFIAQDGKFLALKKATEQQPSDYLFYPVIVSFGIGGPLIAAWGFRCFGMNNRGLRAFFAIISSLSTLFYALSVTTMLPGPMGILICTLWIINWNTFIYERSSILEHLLLLCCNILMFCCVLEFVKIIPIAIALGLFCSLTLLLKWSFVFQIAMFATPMLLASGSFRPFAAYTLGMAAGIIPLGIIGGFVLWRLSFWEEFFLNIRTVFVSHQGKKSFNNYHFPIGGKWALNTYSLAFAGWFLQSPLKTESKDSKWTTILTTVLILIWYIGAFYPGGAGLGVYHILILGTFHRIFMYLKRTSILFPYSLLLSGLGINSILGYVLGQNALQSEFFCLITAIFTIFLCLHTYHIVIKHGALISSPLKSAAHEIDNIVGKGTLIHSHAYAYRLFWQCKARLRAYDEQFMELPWEIVGWCIQENGRFVLLPERKIWPMPLEVKSLLKEHWRGYIPIQSSDPACEFVLYEIIPEYRNAGTI